MRHDLEKILGKFSKYGVTIDEACPDIGDLDRCYRILRAQVWAALVGRAPQEIQQHLKETLKDNIAYGKNLTIDDVYDAQIERSRLYQTMHQFTQKYDIFACPVVGLQPKNVEIEYPTEIDGKSLTDYLDWLKFSFLSPTVGLPSISLPVGFDDQNMPIAIQLIGKPRGEAELLQIAHHLEKIIGLPNTPTNPCVKSL